MSKHIIQLIQSQQVNSNSIQKHQISIEEFYLLCKDFQKTNSICVKRSNEKDKLDKILEVLESTYFSAENEIKAFMSLFDFIKTQYGLSTIIDTQIDSINEVNVNCAILHLNMPMNYFITWVLDKGISISYKQSFLFILDNDNFIRCLEQLNNFKTNFDNTIQLTLVVDLNSKSITTNLGAAKFTIEFIIKLHQLNQFKDAVYLTYQDKYRNLPDNVKPLFNDLLEYIEIDDNNFMSGKAFKIDFNQFPIKIKNLMKLLNKYSNIHELQSLYFLSEAEAIAIASLSFSLSATATLLEFQIANDVLLSTSIKNKPENNTWLLEHITSSSWQGETFKYFEFLIDESGKLTLSQTNEPCDIIKTEDVLQIEKYKQDNLFHDIVDAIYHKYNDVYSENDSTVNGFINEFLPKIGFSNSDERSWLNIWVQDDNAKIKGFSPLTEKKINTILEKSIVNLDLDWDYSCEYEEIYSFNIYLTIA